METPRKKILGYIPARSGSKRIASKNIREFLGKPLIAYAIETALKNKNIARVLVDTDSPKIAEISKKYGADVPFLRPAHLAADTAQLLDSVLYTLDQLKIKENYNPDYVMLLTLTSPLTNQEDINQCVELIKNKGAQSVATVCDTQPLLFNLKGDNTISLANRIDMTSTNSQELPKGYMFNGNVFLIKTEVLRREKKFFTKNTQAIIVPRWRSIDIDTPEDFALAEIIYQNQNVIEEKIRLLNSSLNEKP